MADTEKQLEIMVTMGDPNKPTSSEEAKESETNDQNASDETTKATENEQDELPPPQMSESAMRRQSIREHGEKLRVVVDDLFATTTDNKKDAPKSNTLNIDQKNSSLITRVTSILIDEVNDDTQQFETSVVALPKSPICALLLMESIGVFQSLEKVNQISIILSIVVTILAQISAGATLFTKQLYTTVDSDYETSDGLLNLVVISFIVIYLSQDCAQIYKMVVLLRWMRNADKLAKHSAFLIGMYLITNFLLYLFLLYYSIVELLIIDDPAVKFQAAIAVYFILELDDWLYNVTIEPLKILEDDIFNLSIRGKVGSKTKRLKHVTYWFWGFFTSIVLLQLILFLFKVQDNLTIPPDTKGPTVAPTTMP